MWLDRVWDQQMEKLSFNWDVLLQHKQTPPPSLNKLPEWDSFPYIVSQTAFSSVPLMHAPVWKLHTAPELKTGSDGTMEGSRQIRLGRVI